jgi:transcriptional regulator with XRE-family HTH domain
MPSSAYPRENLARLIAAGGLSIDTVAARCGMDRRTIRGILQGSHHPRAHTLYRLAQGLGVAVDEFFLDPSRLLYRRFDQRTNPQVQEAVEAEPELFAQWREADFVELHSCVGTGGPLTREGALAAARQINCRREILEKVTVLLETAQRETIVDIVNMMYDKVVIRGAG